MITGNLEAYKSVASQVFEEAQIPYFLDEKHSILLNPFVEYIRAALEMVTNGFSYESVFRLPKVQYVRRDQKRGRYAGKLCSGTWYTGIWKMV